MIQKLAKLGKLIPEDMFPDNPLGLTLDFEIDYVVFLEFNFRNEGWDFTGISIEEFRKSHIKQCLIQTDIGNYTPEFPSFPVDNIKKLQYQDKISFSKSTIGKRTLRCLKKYKHQFEGIRNYLTDNGCLKTELNDKINDLNQFLLSFKLDDNYIGNSEWLKGMIKQINEQAGNKDYYTYVDKKEYIAHDKLCSITNEIKSDIWGFVSPYNFYVVKTERAAIPGGFDGTQAWKNFPVSPKGAKYLDRGKLFIEKYLSFRFCGVDYFLIPEKMLSTENDSEYLSYIQEFKKFTLNKGDGKLEEDLLELLKEKDNLASYTLFFYKKNKREFKILASIEDVFPSYAKKIFRAKTDSEDHSIFKGLKKKNEIYNLKFAFSYIKEFVFERAAFLEIVRSIFMQKDIDFNYLLGRIVAKFQTDFANNELYPTAVLKAILILKLLQKLNLIQQTNTTDEVIMDNKYESFFEEHKEFFNSEDSATKKAVFLEGVLAQLLLNIQYKDRKATPFRSRLNSLKLKEKIIKRLLSEIIEKLEQYDKNYYRELEKIISTYLLKAKFWINDNEISFYFTMGMNLAVEFKSNDSNDNDNIENTNEE